MKYNNIFVEGIDGSGKSTLIENIMKKEEYKEALVIHATKETPNTFSWYANLIVDERQMIFDRAFLGDLVYNVTLRLTHRDFIKLAEISSMSDSLLIYVKNSIDESLRVMLERGETTKEEQSIIRDRLCREERIFEAQIFELRRTVPNLRILQIHKNNLMDPDVLNAFVNEI